MKKSFGKIIVTCAVLGSFLPLGSVALAANNDDTPIAGGSVVLNQGELVRTPRENVGGGKWEHGFSGVFVYSQYQHNSRTHSATAKNGNGAGVQDKRSAGIQAFSQVKSTLKGNTAWWNVY